jgi:hypothetical protein
MSDLIPASTGLHSQLSHAGTSPASVGQASQDRSRHGNVSTGKKRDALGANDYIYDEKWDARIGSDDWTDIVVLSPSANDPPSAWAPIVVDLARCDSYLRAPLYRRGEIVGTTSLYVAPNGQCIRVDERHRGPHANKINRSAWIPTAEELIEFYPRDDEYIPPEILHIIESAGIPWPPDRPKRLFPRGARDGSKTADCQGHYLAFIARGETAPTATEIADHVGCSIGTASRAIAVLEAKRDEYAREDAESQYRDHA